MKQFLLRFEMQNDAFADDYIPETVRILDWVMHSVCQGYTQGQVQDLNGNSVGEWKIDMQE